MQEVICIQCNRTFEVKPYRLNRGVKFCSILCKRAFEKEHRVRKTCLYCGRGFEIKPYFKNTAKFCSNLCRITHLTRNLKWTKERIDKRTATLKRRLSKMTEEERKHIYARVVIFDKDAIEKIREFKLGEKNPNWLGDKLKVKCTICNKAFRKSSQWHVKNNKWHFCSKNCFSSWLSKIRRGANNPHWNGGHEPYYGPNWNWQAKIALKRDDYTCQICNIKQNGRVHDIHHIVPFKKFGLKKYEEANRLENLITLCRPCHIREEKELKT